MYVYLRYSEQIFHFSYITYVTCCLFLFFFFYFVGFGLEMTISSFN